MREQIVAAAIRVIESGQDPSMRAVAQAAEIAERTLYRYFASRDELLAAVLPLLRERASAPMADDVDGLMDYIERLFTTFDQNPGLARALARAAWAPTSMTRPANLQVLRTIIDAAFAKAPKTDRESAAASLRVLYSAVSWVYLGDCGFKLQASIRHVQWNTKIVLHELRKRAGGSHA